MQHAAESSRTVISYANRSQPPLKRWFISSVERLSGRRRYERLYSDWRAEVALPSVPAFRRLLNYVDIELEIGGAWPPALAEGGPLVLVANHPFGIGDGAALLSLAEQLGRPFRVLIHAELLKIPEVKPYALPIDFGGTRAALENNLAVKKEAQRLLGQGTTIVIFPAGGVATAPRGLGKARDFPWKTFVAKLIQDARATVLPVHFSGQNGRMFQIVSIGMNYAEHPNKLLRAAGQVSLTMRTALLIREFAKLSGSAIRATVGQPIRWAEMAHLRDRAALLAFLQERVFALEPRTIERRHRRRASAQRTPTNHRMAPRV